MTRVVAATDGSAINNPHGPGGWAWYVSPDCWAAGGFAKASNQYAELFAILALLRATPAGIELLIRTDSEFAIKCLTKWMPGWKRAGWRKSDGAAPANLTLLQELDKALAARTVKFEWVRGHSGDPMNERADKLCTAASQAVRQGRPVATGPGWSADAARVAAASPVRTAPASSRQTSVRREAPATTSSGIRGMRPMSAATASKLHRPTSQAGSNFRASQPKAPTERREIQLEVCKACGGNIDPFTGECRCSD